MSDPTNTPSPDNGGTGDDSNYLTIALAVGIPCGVVIVVLVAVTSAMFYLTCKTPTHDQEAVYMHRRFQGISLEQQRKANKKKKKKGRNAERRESSVSGSFNPCLSRSTSSVSAAARANPFGLQDWQIRMYGGSGPGGGGERGGERRGSPDTEETDVSGDERFQCRGSSGFPTGAINPLMIVRGQDHDPGYDTPPRKKHTHTHHQVTHPYRHPKHTSQQAHLIKNAPGQTMGLSELVMEEKDGRDSSSDDSMNPYD